MAKTKEERIKDVEFEQWLKDLDVEVAKVCGMSHRDLCDFPSRDCFENGESPEDALEYLAEYDDLFAEMLALHRGGGDE